MVDRLWRRISSWVLPCTFSGRTMGCWRGTVLLSVRGCARTVLGRTRSRREGWLSSAESRVERNTGSFECILTNEGKSLGCTKQPIHPGIFPLNREWSIVPNCIEHSEAVFPGHVAVPGGDKVPTAARISPCQERTQSPVAPVVEPLFGVFTVHMDDSILEVPQEPDRVEVLPDEVARVPVQAERLPMPDSLERPDGSPIVKRDFGGVNLVREPYANLVKDIKDWVPRVGEVLVSGVNERLGCGREHGDVLPDCRAGKTRHDFYTELCGHPCGIFHFFGGALVDAFWVAVTPNSVWQDVAVASIQWVVADRLAFQVVSDRVHPEVVFGQNGEAVGHIFWVIPPPGVEVITPARDFESVIPPPGGEARNLFEG